MKKLIYVFGLFFASLFYLDAQVNLPFSETFNSAYSSNFNSSAGTSNAGANYTCTSFNGVGLITSADYLTTKTLYVAQGQGVSLSFKLNKGGSFNGPVDVYLRVSSTTIFSSTTPSNYGWVKIGTASTFSCGTNTFTIPSEISGGQRLSFAIDFKNASSSNWVAIEDLSITEVAGSGVPTTYTENFTTDDWYPTAGYVKIPYHSNYGASNAYTTLVGNGTGGAFDYCASFSTGFDGGSSTNLITPEINTSGYANGELRFAFRSQYPCGGPTSYTFDEDYDLYAPEVYIMEGADNGSNQWVRLPVRYYFPDATWRYATADISAYKNANVKFKFERGGFCSSPQEAIDAIKVFDRNCSVSSQPAGTVTGPANISANTNYAYSISAVTGASYYKWTVRSGGNTYTGAPYIVSGQGTTGVTVNFGNLPTPLRVLCIPYDADPASNNDACYAPTSFISTSSCTPDTASVSIVASDTAICPGEQVNFTATPVNGGATPAYAWRVNNSNTGITTSTFSSLVLNDGDVVTCIMTSSDSCITNSPDTSNAITIRVTANGTASVTIAASDTSICVGEQVDFTATPVNEGSTPVYQWKVNGADAGTGGPTFSSAALNNNETVACIMTSSLTCISGSPDTSNVITMSVNAPGIASVHIMASATSICSGTQVNFTATPTNGGSTPSYQWKVNGINAGTNSPNFSSDTLNDGDEVTCEMTTSAGCTTGSPAMSNLVTITVTSSLTPSISIAASATTICTGTQVDFTATPVNPGIIPVFQWKVNGTNAGTGSTFSSNTLTDNDSITCDYTSTDNCSNTTTVTSNTIVITIATNLTASVTVAASDTLLCPGVRIDFAAIPTNGGAAPSYVWILDGFTQQVTDSSFGTSMLQNGQHTVTCEMTSNDPCVSVQTVTSNTVTFNIAPHMSASIAITASDSIICPGELVNFTANAVNGGTAPHIWKVNGLVAVIGGNGYSTAALNNGDVVTCEITSTNTCVGAPLVVSNSIAIMVTDTSAPTVSIAASSTTICPGEPVDFSATVTNGGTFPDYQWKVNGTDAGTNSATFSTAALNDGDAVTCEIISSLSCLSDSTATSNAIAISTIVNVAGGINASKDTLCAWETTQFILVGYSGSPIRWQSSFASNNNFNDIPNATNDTIDAPLTIQSTYYRAIVGSGVCADTTNVILIVVPASPIAVYSGIVDHNEVTFNSSGSSGASFYHWNFGDGETSTEANPVHTFAFAGSYPVCLTVTNSSFCSDTLCTDITPGEPIGIGDVNGDEFTVYPNPASQRVQITSGKAVQLMNIRIYDAIGKQVMTLRTSKPFIEVSTLDNGMYLLEVQADDEKPQFVKLAVVR